MQQATQSATPTDTATPVPQTPDNGEAPSVQPDNDEEKLEDEEDTVVQPESSTAASTRGRKRKRDQEEVIAKIKKGRAAKKAPPKKKKKGSDDDDDSDFDLADLYRKAKKLPGQLENCELCEKRFTVTPYSKAGPDGGLLCTPCGKEMAKDAKAAEKAKKPVVRKGRRKIESNRLDGLTFKGAKTLQTLCIEKLAKHAEDIDEFGEMPEPIMKRLSEIFSKKRAMNPTTFKLFLQPDLDEVIIHEAACKFNLGTNYPSLADTRADLETEDYDQIFAIVPNVKKLALRNCCQFKDSNVDYMIEKARHISDIQLLGANLVSNDKWIDLFVARGHDLRSFKTEWLDAAFDDSAVEALTTYCTNIERLKLERCKQLTSASIDAISTLQHLQHLTLRMYAEVPTDCLVNLIRSVGLQLRTLCLEHFLDSAAEPDDHVLEAIHSTCRHLRKFRFTENNECSDEGYAKLFTDWDNPPLHYADLNSTRDLDNANPDGPQDRPVGLGSLGFTALMKHSGCSLRFLDISSCRHISYAAFAEVFDGVKRYPHLREINLSFCQTIDTAIVAAIFRSCPSIKKVVTFGCFQVTDVVVPSGIVLIGAPKAQDAIEQFGDTVMDFQEELRREMEGRGGGLIVPVMG